MSKLIKKLKNHIDLMERHLSASKMLLSSLEKELEPNYEEIPGIEGVFDGAHMVTAEGEKFEVPANYAAKSKLLFGTKLKMITEEDKTIFKQVDKPEAKEIEGILSKKEGKWHILADSGSYRVSDVAAQFHGATANCGAIALIPAANLKAPFAALVKLVKEVPTEISQKIEPKKEEKSVKEEKPTPRKLVKRVVKTPPVERPVEKRFAKTKTVKAADTAPVKSVAGDDDLV